MTTRHPELVSSFITYPFPLGDPDEPHIATLRIPRFLSATDAARLRDFIDTLVAEPDHEDEPA
jgi:hypothetical protein